MRRILTMPAMVVALAGAVAGAQPQPSLDLTPEEAAEALDAMGPTNAALVYNQLFPQLDEELQHAAQAFELEPADAADQPMSREDAAKKLAASQQLIGRCVETALMPECDFGLRFQDGWGVLLPHLGNLRSMIRVFRADALRLGEAGELEKAAARADAMFGVADQVRHDRVLISSLVSMAIAAHATETAVYLADHEELTAEGRDMLTARMEALRGADYFGLLDCMTMEYTVSAGWMAKLPADTKPSEWLAGLDMGGDGRHVLDRLDSMSRDALYADAARMAEYYRSVGKVWDDPHAVEKIDALGALAGEGAWGESGRVFLAAMGKVKGSELRTLGSLDEALPKLYAYRPPEQPEKGGAGEKAGGPATAPAGRG